RAVSRSLDSAASKALPARGIEIVVGNLRNKDSVISALRGSEAVFGVHILPRSQRADGKGEIQQGINLADAVKKVGVKFFIRTSLPCTAKVSDGQYKDICHFDDNAVIEEDLKTSGVPYAVLLTGWLIENLLKIDSLQKTVTGYTTFPLPNMVRMTRRPPHGWHTILALPLWRYSGITATLARLCWVTHIQWLVCASRIAAAIAAGASIKKEVTFTVLETSGLAELDDMYSYQAIFGLYADTPVHSPDLAVLGVKFGLLEELIHTEVVPRFASFNISCQIMTNFISLPAPNGSARGGIQAALHSLEISFPTSLYTFLD
ncbi:hypothetical protein B0H13DRAFT_2427474, partial [Mycena leptocephala]